MYYREPRRPTQRDHEIIDQITHLAGVAIQGFAKPGERFQQLSPKAVVLALYTTRDHDCISNRIGSGIRTCPRCGCRLATFGALPTPSTISRDHHAEQSASGPSSSSGKTLSSFHLLLARPCRSALPRERFRSLARLRHADRF